MWKYRYRREFFDDDILIEQCNLLGEQGWSLVGPPRWVPPADPHECLGVWACFFKRTVSNREQAFEALHRPVTAEERAQIQATVANWGPRP